MMILYVDNTNEAERLRIRGTVKLGTRAIGHVKWFQTTYLPYMSLCLVSGILLWPLLNSSYPSRYSEMA